MTLIKLYLIESYHSLSKIVGFFNETTIVLKRYDDLFICTSYDFIKQIVDAKGHPKRMASLKASEFIRDDPEPIG